jgi:hypothetical protein
MDNSGSTSNGSVNCEHRGSLSNANLGASSSPCSIFLRGSTSREKVKVKAGDKTELDDCEEGEGKDC